MNGAGLADTTALGWYSGSSLRWSYDYHAGPFRVTMPGPGNYWTFRDSFARVADGLSNQIFVGEKYIYNELVGVCFRGAMSGGIPTNSGFGDCTYLSSGDERYASAARPACHRNTTSGALTNTAAYLLRNSDRLPVGEPLGNQGFGSSHPGISQFLLGDGAVVSVKITTPMEQVLLPYCMVDDGVIAAFP